MQDELAESVENLAFRVCASLPFCNLKSLLAGGAGAGFAAAAFLEGALPAGALAGGGAVASLPEPVIPPVAPLASIRAAASASVVHVMEVPGELTRGSAWHVRVVPQEVVTNLPSTHCAKAEPMQAFSPAVQKVM